MGAVDRGSVWWDKPGFPMRDASGVFVQGPPRSYVRIGRCTHEGAPDGANICPGCGGLLGPVPEALDGPRVK